MKNNNIKVIDYKTTTHQYKSLKDSLGKTLIGCGALELIVSSGMYLNDENNSISLGLGIGGALIGYGMKTALKGSKLVDFVYDKIN